MATKFCTPILPRRARRALCSGLALAALVCFPAGGLRAQSDTLQRAGFSLPCPTVVGDTLTTLLAPEPFLRGSVSTASRIELRFGPGVPAVAQSALRFAADVWASYLESSQRIVVDCDWRAQEEANVLASAGPSTLIRDFGAGVAGVWYPVALAEALAGRGFNPPDSADINIVVNSGANWYFGTDARPTPGRTDLVTVALHELGHGLGFISSTDTLRGVELMIGFSGRFVVYDRFLEDAAGADLTDRFAFPNPSPALLRAVSTGELFFGGPTVLDVNGGRAAPLFAPAVFDAGSSVSHFDERTFPAGTPNSLMTPFLSRGEAVHQPGPLALALMADLGWRVNFDLASGLAFAKTPTLALRLGPNPAVDRVWAPELVEAELGDLAGEIVDAQGRPRRTFPAHELRSGLAIGDLPPGMYVVRLADGRVGRFVRG